MTVSRRGLLKALGLGGVGLVAGGAVLTPIQEMITEEDKRLNCAPERLIIRKVPHWEHPEMDRIEAVFNLTGGYPKMWGRFRDDVVLCNGGGLNLNYTIASDCMEDLVLYRMFDVVSACIAIGTSIQGPIVRDKNAPDGHRLATIRELIPKDEASCLSYGRDEDGITEERVSQLLF